MATKTHARVLDGSAKSLLVVEHEGLLIKGDTSLDVADAAVITTLFDQAGNYIVSDATTEDTSIIAVINTAGTLSAVKVAGPASMTITKDNAATVNIYIETGVLKVQNLTGGIIDIEVKPYV